ncbi:MAG: alpha/beta hydrolase [Tomitella sp.]|nr:alpha/beta hydrolase [Tomitella sp.]
MNRPTDQPAPRASGSVDRHDTAGHDAGQAWTERHGALHRDIAVDAVGSTLHAVEIPVADTASAASVPVVFCHGFPGSWFSWRHQLPALAAAGRRAIALDMRGYGRSTRPSEAAAYDRRITVADMEAVLDDSGIERAVFVGHDFGAALTWDLPLWLPDRVAGLVQLSVPRLPRSPIVPSRAFAMLAREHFFHQHYFQDPGVADAELDAQPAEFLRRVMFALSGAGDYYACWRAPTTAADGSTTGYIEALPDAPDLPWPWLGADEFDQYVSEFSRSGFTGGLNWYRAQDLVWEQNQGIADGPVTVPTAFIAGDRDPVLTMLGSRSFEKTTETAPGLVSQDILSGAGHFVQMEAADEVTSLISGFLGRHIDG